MMRKIAFIGFGALGNQLLRFLNEGEDEEMDLLFFDDIKFKSGDKYSLPFKDFLNDLYKDYEFCVALGYKNLELKRNVILQLNAAERKIFTFVHKTSFVHPTAKIEDGVFVFPMCNIDQNAVICSGVLLNNSVIISHDSIIEMAVFIAPGVIINGNVHVGWSTFIGAGSIISNSVSIGEKVIVGIGSVVIKNIKSQCSVIGNPLKTLKTKISLL